MKFIRISPVYDAELLSEDYFKEIFIECSTRKGMTRGMIRSYTADFDGDTITLNIKQTDSGMSLINNANSASIISDVIFARPRRVDDGVAARYVHSRIVPTNAHDVRVRGRNGTLARINDGRDLIFGRTERLRRLKKKLWKKRFCS